MHIEDQIKALDDDIPNEEKAQMEKTLAEEKIKKLNDRLDDVAAQRKRMEEEVAKLKLTA